MSGVLQTASDDSPERCALCSAEAAGPCASCHRMVCGDCCTLTEGGTRTWAVCLACERQQGRSLGGAWRGFGTWLVGILVVLAGLIAVIEWLSS